jgi:uncharacterized protein with HEPN domain
MARRDPAIALRHMLDSAREAVELARGRTRADLDTNRLLNLALVRLLEIVGEAANRVPDDERSKHPQIPWAAMVGMRNRLIHAYENVDLDIVWRIVADDLPELVRALEDLFPLA